MAGMGQKWVLGKRIRDRHIDRLELGLITGIVCRCIHGRDDMDMWHMVEVEND